DATAVGGGTAEFLGSAADLYPVSISDDGHYLVYASTADNLVDGETDTNGEHDVFLYDTQANTNTLVSHTADDAKTAGGATFNLPGAGSRPVISGAGNWVAFASNATDLLSPSVTTNGADNVYLYDRAHGTNVLVSHTADSTTTPAGGTSPAISSDG